MYLIGKVYQVTESSTDPQYSVSLTFNSFLLQVQYQFLETSRTYPEPSMTSLLDKAKGGDVGASA